MSTGIIDQALDYLATTNRTNITPTAGSNYSSYGNSWYEVYGRVVHVHLGLQGLTVGTAQVVYTMPSGFRPHSFVNVYGASGGQATIAEVQITDDGKVKVIPYSFGYCCAEVVYMI